jgi:hypothetical protein
MDNKFKVGQIYKYYDIIYVVTEISKDIIHYQVLKGEDFFSYSFGKGSIRDVCSELLCDANDATKVLYGKNNN